MIIGLNVGYASPAQASSQAGYADRYTRMGFRHFRIDGSAQDAFGTPFVPPTPPTPDYSGIDAVCAAYAPLGVSMCVVLYPYKPDTLSWSTAEGGSLCSRYIVWSDPSNMDVINQIASSMQGVIDRWIAKWQQYGGVLSDLFFQWANEMAIGGAGGPLSIASNHGKYDKYSDLAGTVSSPGYFRAQCAANLLEGTVPTDADFDSLATTISRADIANIRGTNETYEQLFSGIDFRGVTVIAPALEHQSDPWGAASNPNTVIGASTIAARERSTTFPSAYGFDSVFSKIAFNIYVGDNSAVGGTDTLSYARWLREMAGRSIQRFRQENPTMASKGAWITEIGLVAKWVPNGSAVDNKYQYINAIIAISESFPWVERMYLYRGHNHVSGDDALSSSTNYGFYKSDGTAYAGTEQIVAAGSSTE